MEHPPLILQDLETNTKKMSYFNGCQNLVKLFPIVFIFFFFVVFRISMAEEEGEMALYELSSREDMVQFAGYGEGKLSTVLVTGTVLCQACLNGEPELRSWPISGALVSVNCGMSGKWSKTNSAKAITDEYGDFLIDLPSHLHAIPNLDKICRVKVLRIPKDAACQPTYVRKRKALMLSSVGNGIRNYSAGKIKFLHLMSKSVQECTKGSSDKQTVQPKSSI